MIRLPWWATALLTLVAKGINQWLANRRAEQALRDLGAATQANAARAEAERQEAAAKAAAERAAVEAEDPADPFLRRDA
ncbi:peptidoglycan-binding protein [Methylobacterium sp. ID0610]|uniref:peptidoglycan-binding protein n=1 Tax=Methylobacterium carpenticola TaxID=3344827 RepID=UPI00367C6F30